MAWESVLLNGVKVLMDTDTGRLATSDDVAAAAVDGVTTALKVIDNAHHEIHEGGSFLMSHTATVGDGSVSELLIITPDTDKFAHMVFDVSATGQTDVDLYKGTAKTAGTAIPTLINHNLNSAIANTTLITHTPAGSGDGTKIATAIFGLDLGTGANRRISGGSTGGRNELVLERDTAYLFRVTSGTTGNRITILLDWYEHTSANA